MIKRTGRKLIARLPNGSKLYVGAALLAVFAVLLASCTPAHPQSTFDASGPVARSQLNLFYWIFWAAVFVFILVGGAVLYTVVRFRRKPGDLDPEQIHGHKGLEISWTVLPAVVLAVVAVPTIITIFDNANSPDKGGLTVDVVGHQWWWEFKYVHPDDPERMVVAANELHIPIGEVVNVNLSSKDVLHSFWIPKLAGKVDLVPNNPNTMWIKAEEAGEYLGQCAEFCGVAHALMRFRVISESRQDFNVWLRHQAETANKPEDDSLAAEGMTLFETSASQSGGECFVCHTVAGAKAGGTTGPNLTHLMSRAHLAAGTMENTPANLKSWLQDPEAAKHGNIMARKARIYTDPDKKLTEANIDALVAYLLTLE